MTTCGWELEISEGRYPVLDGLLAMGLTEHETYHGYHCGCRQCQPRPFYGANQRWFKAQNDCTADGEIISGIFEYGSDEMNEAILGQSHVLLTAGASTMGNVGNHVHVGRDALDNEAIVRLQRLFGRYAVDLQEIAAGPFDNMRTYNGRIRIPASSEPLWTAASDRAGAWGVC